MGGMQTAMLGGDRKEPPCSVQGASTCPSASTSPPARRFTDPPYGLSRRFHYTGHDRMDHWPFTTDSPQFLSPPWRSGNGTGVSNPVLKWLGPPATGPILGDFPEVTPA